MGHEVILHCPHCGNTAPQRFAFGHEYEDRDIYNTDGTLADLSLPCRYEVRICSTCKELILYHGDVISELDVVYPSKHSLDDSVPFAIRECYDEASLIRRTSPSAYAVLLRRGLEAICDDRGAKSGPLHARLGELTSRGEIPAAISEMTAILRNIGNAGAHTNKDTVTVPMTWVMSELFRAVVEYVYVAPSRVESLKKSLKSFEKAKSET